MNKFVKAKEFDSLLGKLLDSIEDSNLTALGSQDIREKLGEIKVWTIELIKQHSELHEEFAQKNMLLEKQAKEMEELRRTKEEYRGHYEKRIAEKDQELGKVKSARSFLETEVEDLEKLVKLQAKFIGNSSSL